MGDKQEAIKQKNQALLSGFLAVSDEEKHRRHEKAVAHLIKVMNEIAEGRTLGQCTEVRAASYRGTVSSARECLKRFVEILNGTTDA